MTEIPITIQTTEQVTSSSEDAINIIRSLINSDPATYELGYEKGRRRALENPNMDTVEVVDDYPDSFHDLNTDTDTPDFKRIDYIHTIGLIFGFMVVRITPDVEAAEEVRQ